LIAKAGVAPATARPRLRHFVVRNAQRVIRNAQRVVGNAQRVVGNAQRVVRNAQWQGLATVA
jgi:ElaB/YqjD/DUF883 family membrane-anchored ribosome-binding protein